MTGDLDDLIRRARRRHIENLLVKQGIRTASVGMGGLILLLLLGTQVLDWRWILALLAVALAAGFRRFPKEIPSAYATAQQIDRRMNLYDSLSTAIFYRKTARRASEELKAAQLARAETLARGVDLAQAVPFAFPRSLYAMAILGLVASSLLALRYGIYRTLDLRPPLAVIVLDAFHFLTQPETAEKKREIRRAGDKLKQLGPRTDDEVEKAPGAAGTAPGLSTQAEESKSADGRPADASKQRASASVESLSRRNRQGVEMGNATGQAGPESRDAGRESANESSSRGEASGRTGSKQQAASSSHESDGLLAKFQDALQSLLSRLRSQPAAGNSERASARNIPSQGRTGQERGQNSAQAGGRKMESSGNGNSQGDDQGEGSQKAQNGPGRQGGREGEQSSMQGRSGIGKNDGSKQIREAEQLAAMGKISEILGKRAQNLTGDVMVEVASGKQELRTAYTQQSAKHSDAGGEIHRDEIPLAYQGYVQQYFDEIRKQTPK